MREEGRDNVAAVIVTYNRVDSLRDCLDAVLNQTRPAEAVYIIDNASTDGTPGYLVDAGLIDKPLSPVETPAEKVKTIPLPGRKAGTVDVHYVRMHKNTGGAGGFYEGVKRSYEAGFGWVWLMDDDGIPAEDQLEELLDKSTRHSLLIAGPIVIDKDDEQILSFRHGDAGNVENRVDTLRSYAVNDVIYDCMFPFNGTLISREVIDRIGNIKKEMFIWGDEKEYVLRAESNNIRMGTVASAFHRHPARVANRAKVLFGLLGRVSVRTDPKAHIYYRNLGYQHGRYYDIRKRLKTMTKYTLYFLINSGFNIKGLVEFYRYYIDGATDRFALPPERE
ncbi:MAG: glycosyltransferase [Nitrospirae bacterium]|nr:glycosyltransferase [Nitrospirota bacterium]